MDPLIEIIDLALSPEMKTSRLDPQHTIDDFTLWAETETVYPVSGRRSESSSLEQIPNLEAVLSNIPTMRIPLTTTDMVLKPMRAAANPAYSSSLDLSSPAIKPEPLEPPVTTYIQERAFHFGSGSFLSAAATSVQPTQTTEVTNQDHQDCDSHQLCYTDQREFCLSCLKDKETALKKALRSRSVDFNSTKKFSLKTDVSRSDFHCPACNISLCDREFCRRTFHNRYSHRLSTFRAKNTVQQEAEVQRLKEQAKASHSALYKLSVKFSDKTKKASNEQQKVLFRIELVLQRIRAKCAEINARAYEKTFLAFPRHTINFVEI
ncbi:hypothetical protein MMC13_000948 [Lambiella insularis]|nr:hypothetical protein [Lambiella insularis]